MSDIDGVPRPSGKSSDIGAREYSGMKAIPNGNQGARPKKWLLPGIGLLIALTGILVFRRRGRKNTDKTGYLFQERLPEGDKPFKSFMS